MSSTQNPFSVGQKVVCINDDWQMPEHIDPEYKPKKGGVFSIVWIYADLIGIIVGKVLGENTMLVCHCSHFAPINVTLSDPQPLAP